jgi:chromosome transmission fidelity protein 18
MDADIAALEAGGLAPEDEFEMDEAMEDELFYGGAPMEAEAMDAAAPAAAPLPVPAAAPAPAPAPAPAAPPAPARYTIPVPTEDGELAMVRVLEARPRPKSAATDKAGSLLGRPFASLLDEVDRERTAARAAAPPPPRAEAPVASADAGRLWVDKYAPRAFRELLSEDRFNRQVLRWIKQWDPHVFGVQRPPAKAAARAPQPGRFTSPAKPWAGGRAEAAAEATRPEKQILLISGPPGLGKTTLAHVAARHAGYRPLEINASDERSAKVMRARVKEATDVQAVFGDRRPPLVVLDEIDGAMGGAEGSGAINELIRIASAGGARGGGGDGGDDDDGAGGGGGAAAARAAGLQRPVICICNDLHAPALRPLRAAAELVDFRAASNLQLAQRLKVVCEREGLDAEPHTLSTLATLAEHDVRTCLNTLQFLHAKLVRGGGRAELTEELLLSAPVGRKDVGKSLFQIWDSVFVVPTTRPARPLAPAADPASAGAAAEEGAAAALRRALHQADVPRVVDGLAENYLAVMSTDPQLTRTAAAADWLSFDDSLVGAQFNHGHFGLMAYHECTVVAFQQLCAVPFARHRQFAFPRAAAEHRAKKQKQTSLLRGWHAALAPTIAATYSTRTLLLEALTTLLRALSPTVRAASAHLLSTEERATLAELIDRMITFGLRVRQVVGDDGQYTHRLEPPLADLLCADDAGGAAGARRPAAGPEALPSTIRQLLATELNREVLRRQLAARGADGGAAADGTPRPREAATPAKPPPPRAAVSEAAKAKAAAAAQEPAVRLDMFGRPVAKKAARKRQATSEASPAARSSVRVKFHEGVTNAVRRTVYVSDLL